VGNKASKNGSSVGAGRNRLRDAITAQPSQGRDAGKDLIERFLAGLDRSFHEHGRDIFDIIMTTRPKLYFRALVMLAQVQDKGSSQLSDLDGQRNRTEALLRLERL
jgi:hypothetical protein